MLPVFNGEYSLCEDKDQLARAAFVAIHQLPEVGSASTWFLYLPSSQSSSQRLESAELLSGKQRSCWL